MEPAQKLLRAGSEGRVPSGRGLAGRLLAGA
jgi:hypothetical protein